MGGEANTQKKLYNIFSKQLTLKTGRAYQLQF